MSEKSLLIVKATPNPLEMEAYEYYVKNAGPIFKKFKGKSVSKYSMSDSIVGNEKFKMLVIMEFPSDDVIKKVFNSEAYQELLPYREKAFTTLNVFICKQA